VENKTIAEECLDRCRDCRNKAIIIKHSEHIQIKCSSSKCFNTIASDSVVSAMIKWNKKQRYILE